MKTLITGGTGSLGPELSKFIIKNYKPKKIIDYGSYEDLKKYLYIGDFYTTYKLMLENPEEVISKITNAQTYINEHYTPKAIGLKWKRVYDRLHK